LVAPEVTTMKKYWVYFLLGVAATAHADVQLNGLFTDNMVLQRDQRVPVWGTADPGEEVTVEFAGQRKTAAARPDGSWIVHLRSMKASSKPRGMTVSSTSGSPGIQRSNLLVGDVWLCGGQSNMAQTMDRYLIWDQVKDNFSNSQLRLFKIKQGGVGSPEPTKALVIDPFFNDSWQACSPEYAARVSATAGFFGMKLQRDTGVPVGLLYANRGATQANMWLPRDVLNANPVHARFLDASNSNWEPFDNNPGAIRAPSHLYNGTIHPLAPFAMRGVIWYQGESDSRWPDLYTQLFSDLADSWRKLWGYEFPFLFVQLAPHADVAWDQVGEARAWLRDAQFQCLEEVPNSGMVVITDAGEAQDIHPQAKDVPGERLALLAASLDDRKVNADFPTVGKMKVKDGKAIIRFNDISGGLEVRRVALNMERGHLPGQGPNAVVAEKLEGFTICGANQKFVKAQATIVSKNTVVVSSADVREPLAVRYGWANFPLCNLYGGNGMPAVPFRTDDFPMPNLSGERMGQPFEGVQTAWGNTMDIFAVGDGTFRAVEVDGLDAWRADGSYLYFKTSETDQPVNAQMYVLYRDEGFGSILLKYDSTSSEVFDGDVPGVWKPAGEVRCENSRQWKVAAFDLPDAKFAKRCNGADIRLQSLGSLTVGGVYVQAKVMN